MSDRKPIYKKWWFLVVVIIVLGLGGVIIHDLNVPRQHESIRYCEVDSDCIYQDYSGIDCSYISSCFNKNEHPSSYIFSIRSVCEPMEQGCCKCENKRCVTYPGPKWSIEEICSE